MPQRRDVIDDPDSASVSGQDQIVVARLNGQVPDRNGRNVATLELRPVSAGIGGDPQAELRAHEQQMRLDGVFLDDVNVAADSFRLLRRGQRRPRLSKVGGDIHVRRHVPERVPVEGNDRPCRRRNVLACTQLTQELLGTPLRLAVTLVQCSPHPA